MTNRHQVPGIAGTLRCESGGARVRFEGADGWVEADFAGFRASSSELENAYVGPDEPHLHYEPVSEHRDFLDAVKTRSATYAPAETGHRTASLAHLGNIVLRLGRPIRWDPERERILDDPVADRMCGRPRRPPWALPV